MDKCRTVGSSLVHLICGFSIAGAYDSTDSCSIDPIFNIVGKKLVGCRDCHRSQLVKAQHSIPELIVALQDKKDLVSLPDSQGGEVVGAPCAFLLHIREGYPPLDLIL